MKRLLSTVMLCVVSLSMILYPVLASASTKSISEINWVIDSYVDEFGRQTSDKIVHNEELIYGKFSNTAVRDATLGVFLVADKTDVYLILYEYGRTMLTNHMSTLNQDYNISILDANNNKTTLRGAIAPTDFRLYFENNNAVLDALNSGSISFAITKKNSQATRYNFTIEDTKGFATLYSQIVPDKKNKN